MSAFVPLRSLFMVRRDAAEPLSNGRMRYDALFSRWGMQDYPNGVEYRPKEEVFAPRSLASGSNSPGVLLHPDKNLRTSFGDGAHAIRGCTGDRIVPHTDGIHTYGQLIVWDSEWNDQIMSGETAELSVGFSVPPNNETGEAPEDAPGVSEYGRAYVSVHRDIVWDHVAGVPEGNADTARVILDATSKISPVTRAAMALIAAERADARAYYFDLGRWSERRDSRKQNTMHEDVIAKIKAAKTMREILDAMIEIKGEQSDPVMQAAIAAAQAMATEPEQPIEQPPLEAPGVPAEAPPLEETTDGEPEDKMDAATRKMIHDRAAERSLVLLAGVEAMGVEYRDAAAGKTVTQMKRDVVAKVAPERLPKIDKHDGKDPASKIRRAAALDLHYDECVELLDARRDWGDRMLEAVRAAKQDHSQDTDDGEIKGPIARAEEAYARH